MGRSGNVPSGAHLRAHRAAFVAIVCIAVLFASGCAAVEAGSRVKASSELPINIPSAQRAALADGKVSLAEYQAAFAAWQQCVASGGGRLRVDSRDSQTGVIMYSAGSRLGTWAAPRADSPEARCYHEQFDYVEQTFMANNPEIQRRQRAEAVLNYQKFTRPCLLKNGISAPEQVQIDSAAFAQYVSQAAEFERSGKCPAETP